MGVADVGVAESSSKTSVAAAPAQSMSFEERLAALRARIDSLGISRTDQPVKPLEQREDLDRTRTLYLVPTVRPRQRSARHRTPAAAAAPQLAPAPAAAPPLAPAPAAAVQVALAPAAGHEVPPESWAGPQAAYGARSRLAALLIVGGLFVFLCAKLEFGMAHSNDALYVYGVTVTAVVLLQMAFAMLRYRDLSTTGPPGTEAGNADGSAAELPLVSCMLAVHNEEEIIEQCVRGIVAQSYGRSGLSI